MLDPKIPSSSNKLAITSSMRCGLAWSFTKNLTWTIHLIARQLCMLQQNKRFSYCVPSYVMSSVAMCASHPIRIPLITKCAQREHYTWNHDHHIEGHDLVNCCDIFQLSHMIRLVWRWSPTSTPSKASNLQDLSERCSLALLPHKSITNNVLVAYRITQILLLNSNLASFAYHTTICCMWQWKLNVTLTWKLSYCKFNTIT